MKDGKQRATVAAKWMANSLLVMLDQYAPNLKKMKAITFSVGMQDGLLQDNRDMDEALTAAGVPHMFERLRAITMGRCRMNFEKKVLPFFSKNLAFGK